MRRACLLAAGLGLLGSYAFACSTGSEETQHGPVFDESDSGVESGVRDATASDAARDGGATRDVDSGVDAPAAVDAFVPEDAIASQDVGADAPAMGDDAGVDAAMGIDAAPDAGVDAATGIDAAGCTSSFAILEGNATSVLAQAWSAGTWGSPTSFSGSGVSLASPPALVAAFGGFLGAFEETGAKLTYTRWSGGTWTPLAQVAGALTKGPPSLAATSSGVAHVVYWGTDDKYYHGTYDATTALWDGASDPVGGAATQLFGPSGPSMASPAAGSLVVAQAGSDSNVYAESWQTSWAATPAKVTATPSAQNTTSPRVVALSGAASDALIVFARLTDDVLMYSVRSGGTWSAPAVLRDTTTFTAYQVALSPLASGGAMLVYQGGDQKGYFSTFSPASATPWTAPLPIVSTNNPALASPPVVAPGVCGGEALAVLAPTIGEAQLMSFEGGAWTVFDSLAGSTGTTFAAVATIP